MPNVVPFYRRRKLRSGQFRSYRRGTRGATNWGPLPISKRGGAARVSDGSSFTLMCKPPRCLRERESCSLYYTSEIKTITTDITGNANYIFLGNGLYDPDYTGGGHQPKFFDTLSSAYFCYFVKSSAAELIFIPTQSSTSGILSQTVSLFPATGIAGTTNTLTATETPYNATAVFSNLSVTPARMNCFMTTKMMINQDGKSGSDQNLCTTNPDPTDSWYWNIMIRGAVSTVYTFQFRVRYDVEFTNMRWNVDS